MPVSMTRSSIEGVTICYVLPVSWMTLCFHCTGPMGQYQARRYISMKMAARQTTSVWSSAAPGGRSQLPTVALLLLFLLERLIT